MEIINLETLLNDKLMFPIKHIMYGEECQGVLTYHKDKFWFNDSLKYNPIQLTREEVIETLKQNQP
jgi:hypothetical protein